MGLYRMIEEDEGDLITDDDGGYDQFNLGVARINHAFQQVKFWEFTQPCLYLARALPYISTGRTVEGYLVSWCFCWSTCYYITHIRMMLLGTSTWHLRNAFYSRDILPQGLLLG